MNRISCFSRILVVLVLIQSNVFAQSGKPLYTHPIGAQAYTFRSSFPKGIEATLDSIQALGITELETGSQNGMSVEEYRKQLDKRKIKVRSVNSDYNWLLKAPNETIHIAKVLGAKFVMIPAIPHESGNFTIEVAKKAVADFNAIGKTLKESGITLCYHNHGFEFVPYEDGTLFDYIVKNTNPEYVSFEMDVLWVAFPGQDPVALLNKYGKRWKLMHLKDLRKGIKGDLTGGTAVENDVALGTGQIDIPAILKAAKKAGIEHYFIEDESPSFMKQVAQSITYIKGLKE